MSHTYDELIALARGLVGFPDPVPGGTDYIDNANVLLWINDGYTKMVDKIFGLPTFVKFTVDSSLETEVLEHDSVSEPTIAKKTDEYQTYKISDVYSYHVFKNLTTGVKTTFDSRMVPASPDDPRYQGEFNSSTKYLKYYWIAGDRGFYLLPHVISETNTILLKYRRKHVPEIDGEKQVVLDYTDEESRGYPVHYAAYMIATQLEFAQKAKDMFGIARMHLIDFYSRRKNLDMGSAPQWGQGGHR